MRSGWMIRARRLPITDERTRTFCTFSSPIAMANIYEYDWHSLSPGNLFSVLFPYFYYLHFTFHFCLCFFFRGYFSINTALDILFSFAIQSTMPLQLLVMIIPG